MNFLINPNHVIALAYFVLGLGIVSRPLRWGIEAQFWRITLYGFGLFILSCGAGHAGLMMTWWDWITAIVSVATTGYAIAKDSRFRRFFDAERTNERILTSPSLEPLQVFDVVPSDLKLVRSSVQAIEQSGLVPGDLLCEKLPKHREKQAYNPGSLLSIYTHVAETGERFSGNVVYANGEIDGVFRVSCERIGRGRVMIRWNNISDQVHYEGGISNVLEAVAAFTAGKMFLHYQPIYRLDGLNVVDLGQPYSYEGLIRWQKDGELKSPSEFLPALDSQNLQSPVFYFTAEEALKLLRDRPDVPKVAINLNPSVLEDSDFPQRFLDLCQRYESSGVTRDRIGVEITEEALCQIPLVPKLKEIKESGSPVSVDDWGSGFATYGQLRLFPGIATYIKLDRQLVSNCHNDPIMQASLKSQIDLFHHLGLQVVAEGIERMEELSVLQRLNCDFGQGYFLGRARALK